MAKVQRPETANLESSREARRCGRKKDAMGMMLMKDEELQTPSWRVSTSAGEQVRHVPTLFAKSAKRMGHGSLDADGDADCRGAAGDMAGGDGVGAGRETTTVQGTVYLANGQPGAGTLVISWPGFTTAAGQAVAADSMTVTIAPDGFVSVNLAPNQGATPAGEYYTAVYYMSDGTVNTQYWVIPAAAQATLAQVQVQIMPATEAVQAVSKAYVDEAITELSGEPADGVGRNAERAAVSERGSDAADAGRDQALRGHAGGDGGSAGGRQHDGRADDAGGERRGGAHGGERTDDAAGGDERGGNEWSDGDSAELRGDG